MSTLDKIFDRFARLIAKMGESDRFFLLELDGGELSFAGKKWDCAAANPAPDNYEKIAIASLLTVPNFYTGGDRRIKEGILLEIGAHLGSTTFVYKPGTVILGIKENDLGSVKIYLEKIGDFLRKTVGSELKYSLVSKGCLNELTTRLQTGKDFYIGEKGAWIESFMQSLADDISRYSFTTFLKQYIRTHIFYDAPNCYPVLPPTQTSAWRKERFAGKYNFPTLTGCSEKLCGYFLRDTFILEQYAVPGAISVRPGDTVIDGGAYIGDTSCYFSHMAGKEGKVYAFEAVPQSAEYARENMRINHCDNVIIEALALSDRSKKFPLIIQKEYESASSLEGSNTSVKAYEGEVIEISTISVDEYAAQHNLKIDFLKADIEGAELEMLDGAVKTISRDKPVLALALYHKRDDFWQIPDRIKAINQNYKFWFRCEAEPMLFAKI